MKIGRLVCISLLLGSLLTLFLPSLIFAQAEEEKIELEPTYGKLQRIGSIRMEPKLTPDKVKVVAAPPFFLIPEPGEYKITLEASSGTISGSIDLIAVITATYSINLVPTEERYDTTATTGKDNFFSIEIQNAGSGTIDSVKFSSRKPSGWVIEFSP